MPDINRSAFLASLRQTSSDFADAAEHVSLACGQRLQAIGAALGAGRLGEASTALTSLAGSREVSAIGSTIAGRGIDIVAVQASIGEAGGTLAKIVIGLTAVAAGGLSAASLPAILCALLIVGGLILALSGAADLMGAAMKKPILETP